MTLSLSLPFTCFFFHLSQYESVITPGNEAIVHHMEVFECSPDVRDVPDYSGSCDDKMKPAKLNLCRHVLAAWAMGAEVWWETPSQQSHPQTHIPKTADKNSWAPTVYRHHHIQ